MALSGGTRNYTPRTRQKNQYRPQSVPCIDQHHGQTRESVSQGMHTHTRSASEGRVSGWERIPLCCPSLHASLAAVPRLAGSHHQAIGTVSFPFALLSSRPSALCAVRRQQVIARKPAGWHRVRSCLATICTCVVKSRELAKRCRARQACLPHDRDHVLSRQVALSAPGVSLRRSHVHLSGSRVSRARSVGRRRAAVVQPRCGVDEIRSQDRGCGERPQTVR